MKLLAARRNFGFGFSYCLLFLLIVIFLLVCPLLFLRIINAFNPMQLSFLESFYIVNNSGKHVELMPIGMLEGSGRYAPLPRYRNVFPPAKPLPISQTIGLPPGAKRKVTYDCDDINFRHILVRDESGSIYILDTDRKGTKQTCYGPQKDLYTIPPIEQLQRAPDELAPCFYGRKVSYSDAKEYP